MSFLYFAYGSNMLTARLTARCPNAKVIGKASALNYVLEFTKPSIDKSGKATLIFVGHQGPHTPGVLFEIAKSDLQELDRAEGATQGYDRHDDFEVRLAANNKRVTATTYLASKTVAHLIPFDWYLALVIAGAHEHELDDAHTKKLHKTEYVIDADLTRKSRADALKALAEHGYDDHNVLLV